ncbi:FAD-dependent oxidoreductase [Rhodococcus globerulus]|nr:FAD-dependent oxidoreductase [Rhodococcus sp. MS16]NMD64321.1 FAD-dependent oxidoreductase [Nocardia globerula]NRI70023.1 FAD-dependent oxidoreductase [Rhodococcus sp. MS16]QXV99832.1 FAD-dependent oxidoreductase [Rhodococcus globerulus]RZL21231.1 MAG: FAD-dependent oxidoreductase [Rhodococcus sp. (in: high G+C Gram-positive bacteria)]
MKVESNKIDDIYDVIVVGSGAGLVGALAAASRGLQTLVIEKTEFIGGTTAYSGSGLWLPGNAAERRAGVDSGPDQARPYLDAIVGDDAPSALREAFLQVGAPMIDELESHEWLGQFYWQGVPDYFEKAPGSLSTGRTIFPEPLDRSALGDLEPLVRRPQWAERSGAEPGPVMTGGQALIARLLLAFVATGNGTIRTNTGLERLVLEGDRVVGVDATTDGGSITIRARQGVLLAAGGYERNAELRQKYQPEVTDEWSQGAPGNTGDALVAGMEIGAATDLLEEAWFAPGLVVPNERPVFYTSVWSGIWVNDAGERFMNERLPYDRSGHEILRAHRASEVSHLPTHWVFDQRQFDNERAFASPPVAPQSTNWFDVDKFLAAGVLRKADTLEELAELIGIPAGALTKSVEQFNEYARSGKDEAFGRGDAPWDRIIVGMCGSHEDGPNPCLGVIDKGPFYAAQIVLSDLGTKGGLKTDENSRVLREDGSVISGLYASGNTMAPMTGRIYPGAGGPVGSSMVFSYLAALDMAGPNG